MADIPALGTSEACDAALDYLEALESAGADAVVLAQADAFYGLCETFCPVCRPREA